MAIQPQHGTGATGDAPSQVGPPTSPLHLGFSGRLLLDKIYIDIPQDFLNSYFSAALTLHFSFSPLCGVTSV